MEVVCHWMLDGVFLCRDEIAIPVKTTSERGDSIIQCPICFSPKTKVPRRARTIVTRR